MDGRPFARFPLCRPQNLVAASLTRRTLSCAFIVLAVWSPTHAWARACTVSGVVVGADASAQRVTVKTSCVPRYSVLRLHEPERVVIDLPDVNAEGEFGRLPIEQGVVHGIDVQAIEGPSGPIGRVVVSLFGDEPYDVTREGQDVVVALKGGRRLPDAPESPSLALNHKESSKDGAEDPNSPKANVGDAGAADPTAGQAELRALLAAPSVDPNAIDPNGPNPNGVGPGTIDAPTSANPAPAAPTEANSALTKFLGLRRVGSAVRIELDHKTRFDTHMVQDPARFVVDLPDARPVASPHTMGKRPGWLSRVRLGKQTQGIRLVFDLKRDREPKVTEDAEGLLIDVGSATDAHRPHASKAFDGRLPHVEGLRFDEVETSFGHEARVFITLSHDEVMPHVDTSNPHAFVLSLPGVRLPSHLEKGLDTRASKGPVSLVSSFQAQKEPPRVHVVVNLKHRAEQRLQPTQGGLCWILRSHDEHADLSLVSRAMSRHAGFAEDAPPVENRLAKKRISLDVKDAEVSNVLRLISEETGENIIASDEVRGKITLKLRNVPAEQALDTLLRVKGFDKVRTNNILRIASAETIQKERDSEVARKRALVEVEEVVIKMVTINYATASEVVDQLKPMLSGRGSVQVDSRTNTLILQDISSNIENLADLARRLDKQTPLVNIQARIVEADSTFVRDLGVQWGGAVKHTAITGNPTGLYFPADVTAQGAADFTAAGAGGAAGGTGGVVAPSRYAVNLPASLTGSGAALGFIMGSAGGAHLLDLRLSAMETNGNGKVISSPEVSTLDNRTARVSQGVSFAVSTVSAAGTNVKFIPAVLELEVTPHVTNDGTVLLKLHVQKSAPDFANRSGQGDPSIQTKEAQTEVLVRDGDTSVIGGILTRNTTESRNEVPFLSKIPLLGYLFREHSSRDTRSELLVFITPRIINRDESRLNSDVAISTKR